VSRASREFQVFAKPAGALCNLDCRYCYYVKKSAPEGTEPLRMPEDILEAYIVQHIDAFPGRTINFSWHGGEPTVLGLDYFRKIVSLQRKHCPPGRRITNGMQTNGTLLDESWCRFLAAERFSVGISIDGPAEMHDRYRLNRNGDPSHRLAMRGYELLREHRIHHDILCVINAENVRHPGSIYRFFKRIGAKYLGFLPLVELQAGAEGGVTSRTVRAEDFGSFLCTIFDEWVGGDVGRIEVQIFEEAARTAFGREHSLCVFRRTCGDIPVIERNGDFYSCDHFVDPEHRIGNIGQKPLVELLESKTQRAFGLAKQEALPRGCRECDVLDQCNGGCPKDRILHTPEGEAGLNFLCSAYRRFFTHCRPFVLHLAALARRQAPPSRRSPGPPAPGSANPNPGRNAPCPCGSGKKYKKCCMP